MHSYMILKLRYCGMHYLMYIASYYIFINIRAVVSILSIMLVNIIPVLR